jgi:hypothetical protein
MAVFRHFNTYNTGLFGVYSSWQLCTYRHGRKEVFVNLLVRKIIYDCMYPVDLENNERSCEYSSIVVHSQTTKYTRFRLIFFKLIDKYSLGWYILFILAGLGCFVNNTILFARLCPNILGSWNYYRIYTSI